MKIKILIFILSTLLITSCGSARKAENERKKTEQKMKELDENKRQFEMKNP